MEKVNHKIVSIIIPFFRGEHLINELLISLNSAINKITNLQYRFEIIFIIDSPETEVEFLKQKAEVVFLNNRLVRFIFHLNNTNIGVAASRNVALSLCNGEIIHFIDQDDAIAENFYIETLSRITDYNFILVNGDVNYTVSKYNSHLLYYFKPNINLKSLILDDFIRSPGQVVFLRILANRSFFPDSKVHKGADDKFFWVTIFLMNRNIIKPFFVSKPLYLAKIHDNNFSADNFNLQMSVIENWKIILSKYNFGENVKFINRNILYLKYITNTFNNKYECLFGFIEKIRYSIDLNRIIRYILKRN